MVKEVIEAVGMPGAGKAGSQSAKDQPLGALQTNYYPNGGLARDPDSTLPEAEHGEP